MIYFEVYPEDTHTKRVVFIKGTGHPLDDLPEDSIFVGSVSTGIFVWHIYVEPWLRK